MSTAAHPAPSSHESTGGESLFDKAVDFVMEAPEQIEEGLLVPEVEKAANASINALPGDIVESMTGISAPTAGGGHGGGESHVGGHGGGHGGQHH